MALTDASSRPRAPEARGGAMRGREVSGPEPAGDGDQGVQAVAQQPRAHEPGHGQGQDQGQGQQDEVAAQQGIGAVQAVAFGNADHDMQIGIGARGQAQLGEGVDAPHAVGAQARHRALGRRGAQDRLAQGLGQGTAQADLGVARGCGRCAGRCGPTMESTESWGRSASSNSSA